MRLHSFIAGHFSFLVGSGGLATDVITRLREKGYLPTFNKRVEITTRELIAPKFLQTDCKSALREIVNMSDQVKLG